MDPPQNFSFIDEVLAGSGMPFSRENMNFLQDMGISYIVSLTEQSLADYFPDFKDHLEFIHLPLFGPPDDAEIIDTFVQIIKTALSNKQRVVVHCQYGQERTGCMLAIYLIEVKGFSVKQAIEKIQTERPSSLQSNSMVRFLHNKYGTKTYK